MDYIEAPNLYSVCTYDEWWNCHRYGEGRALSSPSGNTFANERHGLPDRLSDERRSELMEAARQHLPLGASFSPSILRKHLVPTEEYIPSQSYYSIWDGRGS